MPWSIPLIKVAGVPVRVHLTFFLLLAWLAVAYWLRGGPSAAIDGILFILLLFASVLLHEFGHVFAARRYGIGTTDVTLLPIGGVASIERIPEKPGQEIAIALAGPAVNLVIAGVLVLLIGLPVVPGDAANLDDPRVGLWQRVAMANLVLAVFNMIPAFPMDGGRVLRALLATRFGFLQATRVAAVVGQVLAVVFGFLGLFGNPLLVLVALFIFLAASSEARAVEARTIARGYLASDAMITAFERLGPSSTADDAAALLLRTTQQEFPVVSESDVLEGCVTRTDLIDALRERGGPSPVTAFMRTGIPLVPRNACLETVVRMLGDRRTPAVGVTGDGGRFLGYITAENLSELLMVRGARDKRGDPPPSVAGEPVPSGKVWSGPGIDGGPL